MQHQCRCCGTKYRSTPKIVAHGLHRYPHQASPKSPKQKSRKYQNDIETSYGFNLAELQKKNKIQIPHMVLAEYDNKKIKHHIENRGNNQLIVSAYQTHPNIMKQHSESNIGRYHQGESHRQSINSMKTRKKMMKGKHGASPINEYMLVKNVQNNSDRIENIEKEIRKIKHNLYHHNHLNKHGEDQSASSSSGNNYKIKQLMCSSNQSKHSVQRSQSSCSHSQSQSQTSSNRRIGQFTNPQKCNRESSESFIEKYDIKMQKKSMKYFPNDLNIYESFNPQNHPQHHQKKQTRNQIQLNNSLSPPEMSETVLDSQNEDYKADYRSEDGLDYMLGFDGRDSVDN